MSDSKKTRKRPAKARLNAKQRRFIAEYLKDHNATQAAIRAGYSAHTAGSQGHDLLKKPEIAAAVGERLDKAEVEAFEVLRELKRIALCDIGEAFGDNGKLRNIKEMPEDVRRCIAGVETEELFEGFGQERERIGNTVKVKFWSKTDSLRDLMKHLGLYTEKLEVTGKLTLEQLLQDAEKEDA